MLRLQLLGGFRAFADGDELFALAKQPRRAALLTYLAVERDVARGRVIAALWPDVPAERARHSLNQGIYYLRRIIGAEWVELRADRCTVAPTVSTDVAELEQAAAAGAHADVLRLYQGPFLAGTVLADTVDFNTWVDRRRAAVDRLHRRARREQLAAFDAAGRMKDALQCAEEWCRLDPLEDEAQHRYIELLAGAGQRGAALRQYDTYRRLLDEFELTPLDETIVLVEQLQHGASGPLPVALAGARPRDSQTAAEDDVAQHDSPTAVQDDVAPRVPAAARRPHVAAARPLHLLNTRRGLTALLAAVFAFNWLETAVETWLAARVPLIADLRLELARAAHWLELNMSFEYHELANRFAVFGFSTAYFVIFPLLLVGVGLSLARRRDIRPYRVFALAVAGNYVISLPFFLFFPMPERWVYPDSGAMVLSDLWSTRLIELFRPISGLDNSFPSFHVSLTVLVALLSFAYAQRFRWSVLFLGGTVLLATVALGIHWLIDVVAGAAAGVLSVWLALRLDARFAAAEPSSRTPARAARHPGVDATRQLEPI